MHGVVVVWIFACVCLVSACSSSWYVLYSFVWFFFGFLSKSQRVLRRGMYYIHLCGFSLGSWALVWPRAGSLGSAYVRIQLNSKFNYKTKRPHNRVHALVQILLHSDVFIHAWTKSFGMNKRAFAKSEKKKGRRVRTKKLPFCAWTVRLCLPHQWPLVAIHHPKRKRNTCLELYGCVVPSDPILELVVFFLSQILESNRYSICSFPYLLPCDAIVSAVV